MNLEPLRQKLLSAARANPTDDRVPYAFEKRVMAHLAAKPALDLSALWARAMWRAAAPCVAVSLLLLGVTDRSMTPLMDITDPAERDAEWRVVVNVVPEAD